MSSGKTTLFGTPDDAVLKFHFFFSFPPKALREGKENKSLFLFNDPQILWKSHKVETRKKPGALPYTPKVTALAITGRAPEGQHILYQGRHRLNPDLLPATNTIQNRLSFRKLPTF